jgi:hypothetical protein
MQELDRYCHSRAENLLSDPFKNRRTCRYHDLCSSLLLVYLLHHYHLLRLFDLSLNKDVLLNLSMSKKDSPSYVKLNVLR